MFALDAAALPRYAGPLSPHPSHRCQVHAPGRDCRAACDGESDDRSTARSMVPRAGNVPDGECLGANARTASGAPTAAIRAARNMRRSIRSTRRTSRASASPGAVLPSTRGSRPRIPSWHGLQQLPRHAAHGERRVCTAQRRRPRRGIRPRHRQDDLDPGASTRPRRRCAVTARAASPTGATAATSASSCSAGERLIALNAKTGTAVCGLRRSRRRQPSLRARQQDRLLLDGGAARLPRRGDRRRLDDRLAAEQGGAAGRRPGLRRPHGQAALDVPRDSARGRVRRRDLEGRTRGSTPGTPISGRSSAPTKSWATPISR